MVVKRVLQKSSNSHYGIRATLSLTFHPFPDKGKDEVRQEGKKECVAQSDVDR
jgi:hypothetical protein